MTIDGLRYDLQHITFVANLETKGLCEKKHNSPVDNGTRRSSHPSSSPRCVHRPVRVVACPTSARDILDIDTVACEAFLLRERKPRDVEHLDDVLDVERTEGIDGRIDDGRGGAVGRNRPRRRYSYGDPPVGGCRGLESQLASRQSESWCNIEQRRVSEIAS
jgi:hypothetical protein